MEDGLVMMITEQQKENFNSNLTINPDSMKNQTEEEKLNAWYERIELSISSSKNKLHIQTCSNMIGQFILSFPNNEEDIVLLQTKLDEKSTDLSLYSLEIHK